MIYMLSILKNSWKSKILNDDDDDELYAFYTEFWSENL